MTRIQTKRPRLRLTPEAYRELCRQVLERDGWRCQSCGRMGNLQVHHIQWRSKMGGDEEDNLITLCENCHSSYHGASATHDDRLYSRIE
jgi:5-methylcytosine-specific restriction endonuclease McrA